ncbi:outer membrane protein assembly factor BamB family protein [Cellulomonas chengniuliangii]|uniref:PQQ-binding-like beta-propeller repeat protein n=1 Tax=Cellulomonas chengniuliangii TaxID=2968084 RepID=A0ABY5L105_9CELL|nr:PQQ-binding-like beta-propeller repeat protein [Cellulomonas chengniuliangii]MCC2308043.1 PQQ-binding-like beta-propeller repeat protein [Cellulomonas chengniuliangii]UUI76445.1 PQQ-binding-like beta-propeller repeat protein [Cellulomonas chengniuliangii]
MAPTPSHRMEAVELVEEDLPTSPTTVGGRKGGQTARPSAEEPPPGSEAPPGAARRGVARAVRRWWPIALPLVLVVAAGSAVSAQRERARADRVAAVPGMVRPLDGAPSELWRVPAGPGDQVVAAGGGVAVVGDRQGVWRVTAVDARTGDERWSTRLTRVASVAVEAGAVVCPGGADVGELLVCLVRAPAPVYADALAAAPGAARIVALDSADGTVAGEWAVGDAVVSVARRGDDVVLVTEDPDGIVHAARHDALTGATRWSYEARQAVGSDGYVDVASAEATGEHLLLGGYGTAVLDLDDGAELFWARYLSFVLTRSDSERFGTWSASRGGALHGASGRKLRDLPALPVRPAVDDGTADDVVVLDTGRELSAAGAYTGTPLWTLDTDLEVALVVAGHLVLAAPGRQMSVDAHTGEVAWDVATRAGAFALVSDGALVLTAEPGADGAPVLTARGVEDGVEYWSRPLPAGTSSLVVEGGALLARTAHELVALG